MAQYMITGTRTPFGEPAMPVIREEEPEQTLYQWFVWGAKYPTCVSLQPQTPQDGMLLLTWANANWSKVEQWAQVHKCPYRLDWLHEQVAKAVSRGACSMQWEWDELFPFCMG